LHGVVFDILPGAALAAGIKLLDDRKTTSGDLQNDAAPRVRHARTGGTA
jgi:hypothetical protein